MGALHSESKKFCIRTGKCGKAWAENLHILALLSQPHLQDVSPPLLLFWALSLLAEHSFQTWYSRKGGITSHTFQAILFPKPINALSAVLVPVRCCVSQVQFVSRHSPSRCTVVMPMCPVISHLMRWQQHKELQKSFYPFYRAFISLGKNPPPFGEVEFVVKKRLMVHFDTF